MMSFDGNLAGNWTRWYQRLDIYMIASEITEKTDAVKIATLLQVAGEIAIKVYNSGDKEKYDKGVKKFCKYCEPI